MKKYVYCGEELNLFSNAINWKKYYSSFFSKYLNGRVLEVGAGIASTTEWLCDGTQEAWVCLEPDHKLAERIQNKIASKTLPSCCQVQVGFIKDVPEKELYDVILYIDVLEHIENDKLELLRASKHLNNNGFLIILAPAYQWLFSVFDLDIGHYRRYSKGTINNAIPDTLAKTNLKYIDSVGLFASLSNKYLLKMAKPTLDQILFWDRILIPVSKIIDKCVCYSMGKSLLGIWKIVNKL